MTLCGSTNLFLNEHQLLNEIKKACKPHVNMVTRVMPEPGVAWFQISNIERGYLKHMPAGREAGGDVETIVAHTFL